MMNEPNMNVILIVIDTLRYDFVGANGNKWIHTPNMDNLANESWVFSRCFSSSYPTIPHRTDVITGTTGGSDQIFNAWAPLRFDVMTLPKLLSEAGYCTQLIHDTPHLVNGGHNFDWPFHAWTFIRGAEVDRPWINGPEIRLPANLTYDDPLFDFVDKQRALSLNRMLISYSRANRDRAKYEDWNAAKVFLTASKWLEDNASRNNFFLWIDCFDPHEPWDVPPEFARMYDKTEGWDGRIDPACLATRRLDKVPRERIEMVKNRISALYAGKVSWVDYWLGKLLDTMENTGLLKNTAIVLTSDHGTNVGERSHFGKSIPVREQEGHVPLFVHVPGYGSGQSNIFVQPQDIFSIVSGIASLEEADRFDSINALKLAMKGVPSNQDRERKIAISGVPSHSWQSPERIIFTVFGENHYLEVAAKSNCSHLTRYGTFEDIYSSNLRIAEGLREDALEELKFRHINPEILEWLTSEGESTLPQIKSLRPKGYFAYWKKNYPTW